MQPEIQISYSSRTLKYSEPGHPESPNRVSDSYKHLNDLGYRFTEPDPAGIKDILRVHSKNLVESVRNGNFFDPDTPNLPEIFDYALLSAGGAIESATRAIGGGRGFSLMRPPAHHAGRERLGGFCYFNNLAVAVEKNISEAGRIAIIDIDCHHGQGTEGIFFGRKDILYVSLHQRGIYPGTGLASNSNCRNYPLDPRTGPEEYLTALSGAIQEVNKYKPGLLAISAGFDTYRNDPLTDFGLEIETYAEIGRIIAGLGIPWFAVLEGGYSADMPLCIDKFLSGLKS